MQSCDSGKLSESEFTELLNLQNTYWHKEKTMRVQIPQINFYGKNNSTEN
jgi:hypothetical protein